jgi:predicted acyltransferase
MRVVSVDVLRGFCIVIMILGNAGAGLQFSQLYHADWNGLTLADVIFPMFLFVMGLAIPLSTHLSFRRILRRTIILFALGLVVNGFPYYDLGTLRITGVLQRIAICYLFATLIFIYAKSARKITFITATILIGYWLLLSFVPSISTSVDNLLLPNHLVANGALDPEGLVSTISALASTLIGLLVGMNLNAFRPVKALGCGVLLAGLGLLWNFTFPINKHLWTSSFVLVSGGLSIIAFAVLFYIIEIKNLKLWSLYFRVIGTNAILTYMLSELLIIAFPLWLGFTWGLVFGVEMLALCSFIAVLLFWRKVSIRV